VISGGGFGELAVSVSALSEVGLKSFLSVLEMTLVEDPHEHDPPISHEEIGQESNHSHK
jgi:hypothetical protein